ncbi:DUF4268 domain-containing protein [Haloarchaeobius iranensis]|uniref:DUF4268 domain-containing protein n=1 Tax=Haloarchaeobius iranensis TaxID=996166 RepID=A0A1H0B8V6_9EURY|nr:DUF4268 domain-containing protein [Haloarchaeobius iranensis]SDN42090.1 protein of unknown function [Haloarchaeobius iranensis]
MPDFASLESQEVREYWEHEAQEFTPWVANEIRVEDVSELEDSLGLDLEIIEEEKSVGRYNVDILAEVVDDNRNVVIENQLNPSDHDHLGKSIAYASGVDADIIVWISPRFHDEHRDAIQWLNENSREGVDLFAIRLEVWKIGDSEPAVRLNPVAEPSEWKEKAKRSEGELTDTEKLQEEFWTEFRDRIEDRETPLSARKPNPQHWYNNPIGKTGFELAFILNSRDNELRAELIIRDNAEAYRQLIDQSQQIESEFDRELTWHEPEETRAGKERSRIVVTKSADVTDQDQWDEYLDWMIEHGEQFHDVFYDRIQRL